MRAGGILPVRRYRQHTRVTRPAVTALDQVAGKHAFPGEREREIGEAAIGQDGDTVAIRTHPVDDALS